MRAADERELRGLIDAVLKHYDAMNAFDKAPQLKKETAERRYDTVQQKWVPGVETDVEKEKARSRIFTEMLSEWVRIVDHTITALGWAFEGLGPEAAYHLANIYRDTKTKSPVAVWLILEGLNKVLRLTHPVIVFEYATVGSGEIPTMVNYAGKKDWGHVVEMVADQDWVAGTPRLWTEIHDDNPYRVKAATRNEMKWAIGKLHQRLIQRAYRESKKAFLASLTQDQTNAIVDKLGMTPTQMRNAAKHGSAEVAGVFAARRIARSKSGTDKKAKAGQFTGLPYIE